MSVQGYKVASAGSADALSAQVEAAAAGGWVPLGGTVVDAYRQVYAQALIRGSVPATTAVTIVPSADLEAAGLVKQGVHVADADGDEKDQLNALLASLRTSGLVAA